VVIAAALGVRQALRAPAFLAEAAMFREARTGDSGDVRLAAGGQISPGDRLFLEIEGSGPMHVYVINQDEAGEEYLLFPLTGFETTNPLPGGVEHRLPGVLDGIEQSWVVTSAGGTERFLLVASPEPVALIEEQIRSMSSAQPGAPIRMAEGTVPRLRGVGGVGQAGEVARKSEGNLSELAENLAGEDADGRKKMHVELFELSNP
jgi:hypothetical protein